jgi:hypothetical protein
LEDWKIKVSVLWLFSVVAGVAGGFFTLMEPGVLQQIMSGEVEGMTI